MQAIKDLLNKIKWDKRENPSDYRIFYFDRVLGKLKELSYKDIKEIEGNFLVLGDDTNIPMHRIRKVMKKGGVVWGR